MSHAKSLRGAAGKIPGMVIHVGDSITHANPYGQWARFGQGRTAEDLEITGWSHADVAFPKVQNDATQVNGWYLAAADTSGIRGMTAAGGIQALEMRLGTENGGSAMPQTHDFAEATALVADGSTLPGNLQIETLATAFAGAQFAVVMLGTNDATSFRPAGDFLADLSAIIDALEARSIVAILSTIPPHPQARALAASYNTGIRALARSRALPLIDLEAEILERRPGESWNGTLLVTNDVHLSGAAGAFNSASDPYTPGGNPVTHSTGDACASVGYLLRCWLTVQKLKEVKRLVVDAPLARILPGDANADGGLDISDAVSLLDLLFTGALRNPPCTGAVNDEPSLKLLDANGDTTLDLSDAIYLLRYLFTASPPHILGEECVEIAGCPERCGG